jgi:hypothetical protein
MYSYWVSVAATGNAASLTTLEQLDIPRISVRHQISEYEFSSLHSSLRDEKPAMVSLFHGHAACNMTPAARCSWLARSYDAQKQTGLRMSNKIDRYIS